MKITTVNDSTGSAIDLEEVKNHLRLEVGETNQDDYLVNLIKIAQQNVEDLTNRALTRRTLKVYLDEWPDECFSLPYPPFSTATAPTILYKDADSSSLTLGSTAYVCDSVSEPGRICLDYDEDWPTNTLHNVNPISVQYLCGYNGSTGVPSNLKQAMLVDIADMYENRESIVYGQGLNLLTNDVKNALLRNYRIYKF